MSKNSPPSSSSTLQAFTDQLQKSGRYTFERQEALSALGTTALGLEAAARRLAEKDRLTVPRRGFYVIVPIEYQTAGAPPPTWYIQDLMVHLGHPYYVGLLSAAALHGAAHHQPQEFQVVSDATLRPATVGRSRIRFFRNKHLAVVSTIQVKTPTGMIRVSTPEATAIDLIRYAESAGHLGNVGTVLVDLAEKLDGTKLVESLASYAEPGVAQRLGYLLELADAPDVAAPIAAWLSKRKPRMIRLRPDLAADGAVRNDRWRLLINEDIEVET